MPGSIYCVICGGPLSTASDDGDQRAVHPMDLNDPPAQCRQDDYVYSFDINHVYNERLLARKEVNWLYHFRAFGFDTDFWGPEAKNEASVPGVFLSEEARIEHARVGEVVWLPGPDPLPLPIGNDRWEYGTLEEWDSFRMSWIKLDPWEVGQGSNDILAAHSACLSIYDSFAESCRNTSLAASSTLPTDLRSLVRALRLRRMYRSDLCSPCVAAGDVSDVHFGATRGWCREDSIWKARAGEEWMCADPIRVPDIRAFADSYRVGKPQETLEYIPTRRAAEQQLLKLPEELLDHIFSFCSSRDVTTLGATCRTASLRLPEESNVWRRRTLQLHQYWFKELNDTHLFPGSNVVRWKAILRQLETMRSEILAHATYKDDRWDEPTRPITMETYDEEIYRPMKFYTQGNRKPPLGIKNRLRIYICLESLGKDGLQITLAGQTQQPKQQPLAPWDGNSHEAACPTCHKPKAVKFSRLRALQEGY